MQAAVVAVMIVMILVTGFMTFVVIRNNRNHAKELQKLKTEFDEALKKAVDSINGEGAAQTEIIKQKSSEEQGMLLHLQEEFGDKVSQLLGEVRSTAQLIHTDVHDNLKNIVFDNFASREDKVKSRVMDKLAYAMKYAAHDENYMRELIGTLEKGDARVSEINRAAASIVPPVPDSDATANVATDSAAASPNDEELDAQLSALAELMK